ncbi:MAG TPA: branched-chain amino acid ABC transporter ATP-binding protein/permease [Alphaproteobacteria bacterium]
MIAWLSRGLRAPLACAVLGLAAWPLVFSGAYDLRVFTLAGIYALLVLGYQFIFGHAGALALTQGSFFGLGAYVAAIGAVRYGLTFETTLPLAILVPALLAVIVAAPVLRLQSHYFALATLGIAQVLLLVCREWVPVTGGANGLSGIPLMTIFGTSVARGWPSLILVWSLAAFGAALAWGLLRGRLGLGFRLVRQAPPAADAIGLDIGRYRLAAFVLSAAYAGAAGALFVHMNRVVSPDVFEFQVMVTCLAMTVIGGATRIAGAFAGALLLVYLPEWFRPLDKYYLIAYGAGLLIMIVAAPDGLIGALARLRQLVVPEPLPPAPKPAALPALVPAQLQPSDPLLEVRDLCKSFGGVQALQDVTFEIHPGEILGLIGPNGSGKTTLVNIATGLERCDSGEICFGLRVLTRLPPFKIARLGVARTFQNLCLVDDMAAIDNVAVARSGESLDQARRHAMAVLDRLGLADIAMAPVGRLPQSVQRRIEIARALALQPALLFLDEPAAGLSDAEQADLADHLRRLKRDGLTLLIIEHNMPFLTNLADRMVCLDGGRVIAHGPPEKVRAHKRVIEAYLGRTEAVS